MNDYARVRVTGTICKQKVGSLLVLLKGGDWHSLFAHKRMVHIYPFLDNSLMQKEAIKSLCCPPLHPLLFSPILQWLLNIIERSWRNHIRLLSRRTGEWVDSKLTIKTKERVVAWTHKRCLFIEVDCTWKHETWFYALIKHDFTSLSFKW